MTVKELLILLLIPLGILATSLYTAHINYKIAQEKIEAISSIPDIDALKIRIHKEGKDTAVENMSSFLNGLRTLLINQKESQANLAGLIYQHFIYQIIFSFLWCVLVVSVYRANRKRTKSSNN